jgi:hypothetical protein
VWRKRLCQASSVADSSLKMLQLCPAICLDVDAKIKEVLHTCKPKIHKHVLQPTTDILCATSVHIAELYRLLTFFTLWNSAAKVCVC